MTFQWPRFKTFKTVDDLEEKLIYKAFSSRLLESRSQFKIAVIDDEPFTPLESLRRHHYDIMHMKDVDSIDMLARFQIVLCDLNGVGISLSPTLQGAHIISELKNNYPEKVVIAYTGGGGPSGMLEKSIEYSDYNLAKDANVEEWQRILDLAINDLANPVIVWKKLRHRLLDAGLTPYKLAIVEDIFVKTSVNGKSFSLSQLDKESKNLKLSSEAATILKHVLIDVGFEIAKKYIQG